MKNNYKGLLLLIIVIFLLNACGVNAQEEKAQEENAQEEKAQEEKAQEENAQEDKTDDILFMSTSNMEDNEFIWANLVFHEEQVILLLEIEGATLDTYIVELINQEFQGVTISEFNTTLVNGDEDDIYISPDEQKKISLKSIHPKRIYEEKEHISLQIKNGETDEVLHELDFSDF